LLLCSGRSNLKKYLLPILLSNDGSFYFTQDRFFFRNKSCSCTTCIVYVNLFKDRFFYVGFLFRKADAKVKTFKYIFQIFSEVFFHLSFFPSSLLRKGEQKKDCFTDPDSRKSVNQRCLLFESGCKGKNFISYLPNVFGSFFFILLFQRGNSRKKQAPSRRNR
jgi:hypothetical protein